MALVWHLSLEDGGSRGSYWFENNIEIQFGNAIQIFIQQTRYTSIE